MERYLSREAYEKLKKELAYLETEKRKEVAERLQQAASFGDLTENAAYDDAKDAKSFLEGKIAELKELLRSAKIADKAGANFAAIGSKLVIAGDEEEMELEIVSPSESDPLKGKISYESPLGKALLKKKKGDTAEVKIPGGKIKYKIIKIRG